ncbi:MAG: lytic transglycosylase domain-containing protein [Campylobacterales bacterium]|nr:lytic transglycosylase domain-containing protein [Campylobacterales bacterium]
MRRLLSILIGAWMISFTFLYASSSSPALNASLSSIGVTEPFETIKPLSGIQKKYSSNVENHYKRYQETQEDYKKVEEKFKRENVPLFFSLIPYTESHFKPRARGPGTAGLWQFTILSAHNFGLSVQKGKDERFDIDRSTDAAIACLKSLKKEFGSWYLADFAYGMGEGSLKKLIEKNKSNKISVLLNDPSFPSGTKSHFAETLLLDGEVHYGKGVE